MYIDCVVNSKQNTKLQQKHCQSDSALISHHHYYYQCIHRENKQITAE